MAYKFEELLDKERDSFKKDWAKNINFENINKKEVKKALKKALNATLNRSIKHKDFSEAFVEEFSDDFINFASNEEIKTEEMFKCKFDELIKKYNKTIESYNKTKKAKIKNNKKNIGHAQKFVSLSFKLLYCFDNVTKDNFKFCNMVIDSYTLNWYNNIKGVKKCKTAWSNLEETEYKEIQENIKEHLKKQPEYQVVCYDDKETVELSEMAIESEFVIWEQEKLNKIYKSIKAVKGDRKIRLIKK